MLVTQGKTKTQERVLEMLVTQGKTKTQERVFTQGKTKTPQRGIRNVGHPGKN